MTQSMMWYLSDLERKMMTLPGIRVRLLSSPALTDGQREQIQEDDRAARSHAAQRAECVSVACPKCGADQGARCNGRIARNSNRRNLGFHRERLEAAFPSRPAQPKAAIPASATPAAATKPMTHAAKHGPSNAADFPFAQRRFREAQHRLARVRGDYLATEHGPVERPARIKFRPFAAAPIRVGVGGKAWDEIKALVQNAAGEREVGGALLGFVLTDVVRVTQALPPAANADMTLHGISGHIDRAKIAETLAEAAPGLQVVGGWHSHTTADAEPSRSDMLAMSDNRTVTRIKNPIELIATPSEASWFHPTARVWMLTDTDDSRYDLEVRTADLTGPLA